MITIPIWHIVLRAVRLYDSRRLSTKKAEVLDAVKGVTLATGLVAVLALLFDLTFVSLRLIAAIWVVATLLMVASRMLMRFFLQWLRVRGHNLQFVLIIGYGERAQHLIRKFNERNDLGYRVIGCVDNIEDTCELPAWSTCSTPLLGDLQSVPRILAENPKNISFGFTQQRIRILCCP